MLDIRDLDNYDAIHFIRNTYGKTFAAQHQYDEEKLPDRLLSDRLLVAGMEKNKADGKEEELNKLYTNAIKLQKGIDEMKINDDHFEHHPTWIGIIGSFLALILLFPFWVFALWPNALHYVLPTILINRMKDKMFYGTFVLTFSVMITIPLFYTLTFILTWVYVNIWLALIYLAALPLLGLFAWYYRKFYIRIMQALRFQINFKTDKLNDLFLLRKELFEGLNKLLLGKIGERWGKLGKIGDVNFCD
jgi:ABC-type multidrug transport system fused ATPase/permease subunit